MTVSTDLTDVTLVIGERFLAFVFHCFESIHKRVLLGHETVVVSRWHTASMAGRTRECTCLRARVIICEQMFVSFGLFKDDIQIPLPLCTIHKKRTTNAVDDQTHNDFGCLMIRLF